MADYGQSDFPVVGIGASAGGLEALREFVKAIPRDSGIAYVVIQHLAADHPSIMDQLLGGHAHIPVRQIDDGEAVEPNVIYVLPAGPSVTIKDGKLSLHERKPNGGLRTPIDEFLSSLAKDAGSSAMCVILSGTGSDGTLGVRAIKAAGGFAIVQKSDSARFPGMPDSAAATGLVDFVLPPGEIPYRLIEIWRHRSEIEEGTVGTKIRSDIESALPSIVGLLDEESGHNFANYKPGTLVRRIERRMMLLREWDVESFIERLREHPEERTRLVQDFLIGVTEFFRDKAAFEVLKNEAINPLLESDRDKFRIWVPGCSTGEEAYSIAIFLSEAMTAAGDSRSWQIFGTDIDSAALAHARSGIYTETQIGNMSEDRRARFFIQVEGNWQVSPGLRERCLFAPHNLLQDPPFSRLDLISCRNLLIYLTSDIQGTIIPRFHYALNPGGYLFLGPSEGLGTKDRFFINIDREYRLFRRNDSQEPGYSSLTAPNQEIFRRERKLPRPGGQQLRSTMPEPDFEQQVTSFFLRESAAPFAVVNADDEVSFISERMGRFIKPPTGTVSSGLDQFLARELRLPVRGAIDQAREEGRAVAVQNIVVEEEQKNTLIDLDVRPLPFAAGSLLVTLNPVRTQDPEALANTRGERDREQQEMVERELTLTRQRLANTLSNYETTEQELRSSNEELLSMNEELQSSNEELETSREELQSINEELETINAELAENNRKLGEANSDLQNLFDSTDIATVFLDPNMMVRRYTPAAKRLLGSRSATLAGT